MRLAAKAWNHLKNPGIRLRPDGAGLRLYDPGVNRPSVLTIGNFDGVHAGHRAILSAAREHAGRCGGRVVALAFDPSPVAVLRPGEQPPRLDSLDAKRTRLLSAGADQVAVIEPTPEVLGRSAEGFIAELVERYQPVAVVEGPDFRFGKGRVGDHALLAALGGGHGFEAVRVDRVTATLHDRQVVPVTSSLCRWLVGRGRVEDAARCLGRRFELTAAVVKGEQRGRTIGVPTANLDAEALEGFILPADGVYACEAVLVDDADDAGRTFPAAVSIGVKPTFGQQVLTVEAHLLGFEGDLYGQRITLRFARWLRDQYPFPGLAELKAQLARDITATRDAVASPAETCATSPAASAS